MLHGIAKGLTGLVHSWPYTGEEEKMLSVKNQKSLARCWERASVFVPLESAQAARRKISELEKS